ncbi:MAG: endolytic transglycosylase MltG [Bacteroidetes bacterium]|nr:endolytic transglycosylase MltG [Bacteroidota bacterium]HET6244289.1 endolytic transglycosylase MltG [Bacteroidia bacterium]
MAKKKKGGKSFIIKIIIAVFLILMLGGGFWAYDKYKMIHLPNVFLGKQTKQHLYIPTGSSMQDVVNILYENGYIINKSSFEWLAEQKNYRNHVYPGKYLIKTGMSNNKLIDLLRSGEQEPIKLTFNSIRTKEQLAGRIGLQIEADSLSLIKLIEDVNFLATKYKMGPESALTLFIPNTYEFYWNTSAEQFLDRMAKEYKAFWTEDRKAKSRQIGLTQSEVTILASIVQAEQARHNDEKPIIAGLYLNRLKKGMRLESDPTLVYAHGDFSINRVLNIHKEINSPYNTYRNAGLPPGPINLPEVTSLDAVLNFKKNDYIFMCAKEDFSGYHNFSKTLEQHGIYAQKYRAALNKRKIMK